MLKLNHTFLLLFTLITILHAQDSLAKKSKLIHFFFKGAAIVNKGFSNINNFDVNGQSINQKNFQSFTTYSESNKQLCFGYNFGLGFLIGKQNFIKQIVELNFSCTNSSFSCTTSSTMNENYNHCSNMKNFLINRQVLFVGFDYGVRFKINERLTYSMAPSLNIPIKTTDVQNGYLNKDSTWLAADTSRYYSSSSNHSDFYTTKTQKTNALYLSFKIQLGYDFKIKSQHFHAFILRNFGLLIDNKSLNLLNTNVLYISPWWMIGIEFYPFKKQNKQLYEK